MSGLLTLYLWALGGFIIAGCCKEDMRCGWGRVMFIWLVWPIAAPLAYMWMVIDVLVAQIKKWSRT